MNEGYFLGISTKQVKRKILAVTFSLFVLQIVLASQVFASSPNSNDGIIGQTTAITAITATTVQNSLPVALSAKVRQVIPVTGVSINKSTLTLKIKSSETLKAIFIPVNATNKNVYWNSSDTAIATVGLLNGKVVGLKVGTATITVFTEDGNIKASCDVNVFNPDIVTFTDINLENAIRKNINKPTGDLLKSDIKAIVALDAGNNSISELGGIENLINLQRLNLNSDTNLSNPNQISDISALKGLTKLSSLRLSNNQINNIDTLKSLKKLTSLDLSGNQIQDISTLVGLTKLTSLYLSGNQISDIIYLKKLTQLRNLYLDHNQISNINPLKVSTKLRYLDLSENLISELDGKSLKNALPKCKISF